MTRTAARRPRRAAAAVLATVGSVLVLAACSDPAPVPAPPPTPSVPATSPSSPAGPSTSPAAPSGDVLPLTGRPGAVDRPALVVKVENSAAARPQSGLQAADIVVEELVEGGITRFAAMYHSRDPGTVGPVRSVRHVDVPIAAPTRGILAFSGGAKVVLAVVREADLQLAQQGDRSGAFYRSPSRRAPHNLYLRAGKLWAAAGSDHSAPPPAYLPFVAAGSSPAGSGAAVTRAALRFSAAARPSWSYDATKERWLRSENGRAAVESSGARLGADTVLVLRVKVGDAGYRDPAGNPVPETRFVGSGPAVLLHGGRAVEGTWSKASAEAALVLIGRDGGALGVPVGRTWIELLPVGGRLSLS